tara:strand:- start:3539 stop:5056 length:1518 start_codon:yes stop_codon:yes gene_type:complete
VPAQASLDQAIQAYDQGKYFQAARYAFQAAEGSNAQKAKAYAWTSAGLMQAGLYQSALYFFIRTLEMNDLPAKRVVLKHSESLMLRVGSDVLRNPLIRYTSYNDYDPRNRSAFLYTRSRESLLKGNIKDAINEVNGMSVQSPLFPFGLMVRGTSFAIQGNQNAALSDYKKCVRIADQSLEGLDQRNEGEFVNEVYIKQAETQLDDLKARCQAGVGRVLYQFNQFEQAEIAYDRISKDTFVWTDILFEQAWNAFAKREYNRSLGKLVSYKSPALQFVFNSEVDVLRAQSYLALCLYSDANKVINQFNAKYGRIGIELNRFLNQNKKSVLVFYQKGKNALQGKLHTKNKMNKLLNRFVRSPYFQNLVQSENQVVREAAAMKRFDQFYAGKYANSKKGFVGFLNQVLKWRVRTIQRIGGTFVRNSLIDHHQILLSDFDKIAFIKLEMLQRAKDRLVYAKSESEMRTRGNIEPSRRDDQYRWGFNGEFWNDEIGDYVFGLESECGKKES